MIRTLDLALVFLLPAVVVAQSEPQAEWQKFLAENGPAWSADWNPATDTPNAIFGTGLKVAKQLGTIEEARIHAEALFVKYGKLLGRGDSEFVELDASQIRHMFYFIYGQKYKGLDVRGARADVRINNRGVVALFGSAAVRIPERFNLQPGISADAARALAEGAVLGRVGAKKQLPTELMIWADPFNAKKQRTVPILAWEVQLDERPNDLVVGKAYINAVTGALIHFENEVYNCGSCGKTHILGAPRTDSRLERSMAKAHALAVAPPAKSTVTATAQPPMALTGTVMAWVVTGHNPHDPLVNVPMANLQVTSSAGSAFTDDKGQFSIPYTGTTSVTVSANLAGKQLKRVGVSAGSQLTASAVISPTSPGTIQFASNTATDQVKSQTNAYYFTDDIATYIKKLVGNKPTQWAQLDGMTPQVNLASSCNAYYTNFTINFYDNSTTCNYTAYEGVVYHEWGHGLDHAFGGIISTDGLSEGWADVLTLLRSQQPIIGPKFFKSQTPDYVRTALNTKTYPTAGGTHTKGEVWMGWVWDFRTFLAQAKGTTVAQIIAEQDVIPTIVANSATLEQQIREIFILDDDDGNLANGTPNYNELEKASLKRTIKFPQISAGILTHTPLKTTDQQLTPRLLSAIAMPIVGSFQKVEVIYDIGAGNVRLEMVPSGKKDEYIALVPGVLSPKIVDYYIEGLHSTNKILRAPDVGNYSFSVGKETEFFFDDFETAKPGWSTGNLSGTGNDFQRGTSSGLGGSAWNVAWKDPAGAFSGKFAWGNNLAGAYAGNQSGFLRSPTLNMTGNTNIRLRFMRWLQVQESKYDFAKVLVNNTEVWRNSWSADHLDFGWTKFDVRLAAADNNASVFLEWQMITDGGKELAGWNIDDVSLYSFQAIPAPKMTFEIAPAQVGLGKSSTVTLKGTANAPILILISATEGPTNIPGLPTLHVGAPFVTIPVGLDATGKLTFNFTAPTSGTGQVTYLQALEQTNASTITASNPSAVLWGK